MHNNRKKYIYIYQCLALFADLYSDFNSYMCVSSDQSRLHDFRFSSEKGMLTNCNKVLKKKMDKMGGHRLISLSARQLATLSVDPTATVQPKITNWLNYLQNSRDYQPWMTNIAT